MSKEVRDVIASVAPRRLAGDRRMLMGGSGSALRPAYGWIGTIPLSRQDGMASSRLGAWSPLWAAPRRRRPHFIGRVDAKQTSDERKGSSARPEADTLRAAQIAETRARSRRAEPAKCLGTPLRWISRQSS
jgi:hypothetical protein